jgi:hypothetical protein
VRLAPGSLTLAQLYLALDIEAVLPLVRDGAFERWCPGLRPGEGDV